MCVLLLEVRLLTKLASQRDVWTETEHAKVVHFKECAEVGAGRFKSCEFYLTYRAAMRAALANESRIA